MAEQIAATRFEPDGFGGELVRPDDENYDAARQVFSTRSGGVVTASGIPLCEVAGRLRSSWRRWAVMVLARRRLAAASGSAGRGGRRSRPG